MIQNRKIVIAVSGSSGAIYAKLCIEELLKSKALFQHMDVVFSSNAERIWEEELDEKIAIPEPIRQWAKDDFNAPFASGSANYDTMIVIPCSMGILGRIANGISNDLISRAADVMLKERKKIIFVVRDTPLNLIHIENMRKVTAAGGIICPANPSFYSKPKTIEEVAQTVVHRVLDLASVPVNSFRWGLNKNE